MMPYSNEYDAIPICRTHARSLCVLPNFQATTRATSDNFVACRSRCRFLCVHTLNYIAAAVRIKLNKASASGIELI